MGHLGRSVAGSRQVDDCHEATSEKEIQALAAVTGTALKAPPNLISSLNNGDGGG